MRSCCASCVTTHAHNRGNVQGQSHRSAGTANSEENPGTLCALVTNCIYLASKQLSSEHAQTHTHTYLPECPLATVHRARVSSTSWWTGRFLGRGSGRPPRVGRPNREQQVGNARTHQVACLFPRMFPTDVCQDASVSRRVHSHEALVPLRLRRPQTIDGRLVSRLSNNRSHR